MGGFVKRARGPVQEIILSRYVVDNLFIDLQKRRAGRFVFLGS